MTLRRALQVGFLAVAPMLFQHAALAQLPHFPIGKRKDPPKRNNNDGGGGPAPAGVPVPADSPIFLSFNKLAEQSVYHQKFIISANDPQMQQMMAQMGFAPTESIVAGDAKQVSMHMQMPIDGKLEDMEIRTVLKDGRLAKKWITPASDRILAKADAKIAEMMAQQEENAAKSIGRSLASGPMGAVSAAMASASVAANAVAAGRVRKTMHDFFQWTCMDSQVPTGSSAHREIPPLTDLRTVGDDNVNGMAVTTYEFYVKQDGRFQGPMQMMVAKDSGLPARIGMSDPRAGGSMHIDYWGFNQGGDFEIPACLAK